MFNNRKLDKAYASYRRHRIKTSKATVFEQDYSVWYAAEELMAEAILDGVEESYGEEISNQFIICYEQED